jgi:hypothetical protein
MRIRSVTLSLKYHDLYILKVHVHCFVSLLSIAFQLCSLAQNDGGAGIWFLSHNLRFDVYAHSLLICVIGFILFIRWLMKKF